MEASIQAAPDLVCALHPEGNNDSSAAIPVFTDADGWARFYAVRATTADAAAQRLTLDCNDPSGKASTYPVDLQSDATFASHPFDLAKAPGVDRPALPGDPLSYSQSELIQAGYGLRPDPAEGPGAYAQWLLAAQRAGRRLVVKQLFGVRAHTPGLHYSIGSNWIGATLLGATSYNQSLATFNVPKAIHGGEGTSTTNIAVWNGVGGNTSAAGDALIQGGVDISTTKTTASYASFREYCCGDAPSNNYSSFTPKAGEEIFSQAWYCDKSGNPSTSEHYGCTFMQDMTTGAILSCTQPNDSTCASVPPLTSFNVFGDSGDFIIEITQKAAVYPDFTPKVTMAGSAYSTKLKAWKNVTTDPSVTVLTDPTSTTTHINVTIGSTDQVYFSEGEGPPPPSCKASTDCSGMLSISCTGKDVGVEFNGNCRNAGGEPQTCIAGFTGASSVTAGGNVQWLGSLANEAKACTTDGQWQDCITVKSSAPASCPTASSGPSDTTPQCSATGYRWCPRLNNCAPESECTVTSAHP